MCDEDSEKSSLPPWQETVPTLRRRGRTIQVDNISAQKLAEAHDQRGIDAPVEASSTGHTAKVTKIIVEGNDF